MVGTTYFCNQSQNRVRGACLTDPPRYSTRAPQCLFRLWAHARVEAPPSGRVGTSHGLLPPGLVICGADTEKTKKRRACSLAAVTCGATSTMDDSPPNPETNASLHCWSALRITSPTSPTFAPNQCPYINRARELSPDQWAAFDGGKGCHYGPRVFVRGNQGTQLTHHCYCCCCCCCLCWWVHTRTSRPTGEPLSHPIQSQPTALRSSLPQWHFSDAGTPPAERGPFAANRFFKMRHGLFFSQSRSRHFVARHWWKISHTTMPM